MPDVQRSPRHAAMDLLARREHSRAELARKLMKRYEHEAVEEALDGLAGEGLQSDHRFAEAFARERALRGYGPGRIVAELGQRGVEAATAESAIAAMAREEQIDWRAAALEALEKKFGSRELPGDFAERARRLRFLNYRGFNTADIGAD